MPNADIGDNSVGESLTSLIERIEALEIEKKSLGEDIKEIFSEAKGKGFDTKIMREILRLRKMDFDDLEEYEGLLDLYKVAVKLHKKNRQELEEEQDDEDEAYSKTY